MNEKLHTEEEEENTFSDVMAYQQIPGLLEKLFVGDISPDDKKKLLRYVDTLYLKMRRGAW